MTKKIFYLKNMISKSCIQLIELYFNALENVKIQSIVLGKVDLIYDANRITINEINSHFEKIGFQEIVNPRTIMVEQTKLAAIELIYMANNTNSLIRNSQYISERVQENYSKLSKAFSEETGVTLEKYLILLKIEKTKELLIEKELSLSEIAYMLGYSSVHYLSNQFKKITGLTVSQFKSLDNYQRTPLEKIL